VEGYASTKRPFGASPKEPTKGLERRSRGAESCRAAAAILKPDQQISKGRVGAALTLMPVAEKTYLVVQTGPASLLKVLWSENQSLTAIEGAP